MLPFIILVISVIIIAGPAKVFLLALLQAT